MPWSGLSFRILCGTEYKLCWMRAVLCSKTWWSLFCDRVVGLAFDHLVMGVGQAVGVALVPDLSLLPYSFFLQFIIYAQFLVRGASSLGAEQGELAECVSTGLKSSGAEVPEGEGIRQRGDLEKFREDHWWARLWLWLFDCFLIRFGIGWISKRTEPTTRQSLIQSSVRAGLYPPR